MLIFYSVIETQHRIKGVLRMRFASLFALALALLTFTVPASAYDRKIKIVNYTDRTVMSMNVSNVGSTKWGPDQFEDDVLEPHTYWWWDINDGTGYCTFDFRFRMRGGDYKYLYNFNVCANYEIHIVE